MNPNNATKKRKNLDSIKVSEFVIIFAFSAVVICGAGYLCGCHQHNVFAGVRCGSITASLYSLNMLVHVAKIIKMMIFAFVSLRVCLVSINMDLLLVRK